MSKTARDVARLSFEDALKELEELVQQLEQGEVRLEDSLKLYRRGEALKRRCTALLAEAQTQIEHMTEGGDAPKASGTPPARAASRAAAAKSPPPKSPSNDDPFV